MTGNYPAVTVPDNMVDLIGQYEYGLKYRIYEIVNHVVGKGQLTGARRPAYIHNANDVRFLAPLRYPGKMLNAAGNFFSHTCEACTAEQRAEAGRSAWRAAASRTCSTRRPAAPSSATTMRSSSRTAGTAPTGKWSSASSSAGRPATSPPTEAGTTSSGTRSTTTSPTAAAVRRGLGQGSDWLVGKGHETFAPLGPWIVPAEFYGDPTKKLHMQLYIGGKLVQEAKVEDMIHNVWELIEYALVDRHAAPGRHDQRGHDLRHVGGRVLRRHPLGLPEAGRGDGGEDRRDRDASQPGRRRSGAREGQRRTAPAGQPAIPGRRRPRPRPGPGRAARGSSSGRGALGETPPNTEFSSSADPVLGGALNVLEVLTNSGSDSEKLSIQRGRHLNAECLPLQLERRPSRRRTASLRPLSRTLVPVVRLDDPPNGLTSIEGSSMLPQRPRVAERRP